ncbi:MAG: hypothetical protein LLG02_07445 [Pelosinus sp.]|nr:hypothetical protein [Pelosinus sp.]
MFINGTKPIINVKDSFLMACCSEGSSWFTEPLLGDSYVAYITQLAEQLNFLTFARKFGLETPLGPKIKCGDFFVYMTRSKWLLTKKFLLPPVFAAHPSWQRIQRFAHWWSDKQGLAGYLQDGIWLEFDVHPNLPTVSVPSLFFGILTEGKRGSDIINAVDDALNALGAILPTTQANLLKNILLQLLPECKFFQIGIMLGRQAAPIRLCTFGMEPKKIPEILQQIGISTLSDLPNDLWQKIFCFSNNISSFDIDIGMVLGKKVGLEMKPAVPASVRNQHADMKFREYLSLLKNNNLCSPDKGAAVLNWLGATNFIAELHDHRIGEIPVFRTISHIKIDFEQFQSPRAKAYLEYNVGYPEGTQHEVRF